MGVQSILTLPLDEIAIDEDQLTQLDRRLSRRRTTAPGSSRRRLERGTRHLLGDGFDAHREELRIDLRTNTRKQRISQQRGES